MPAIGVPWIGRESQRHPPDPWIEVLKCLREFCRVVVIKQCRTSNLCDVCYTILQPHKYWREGRDGVLVLKSRWGVQAVSQFPLQCMGNRPRSTQHPLYSCLA